MTGFLDRITRKTGKTVLLTLTVVFLCAGPVLPVKKAQADCCPDCWRCEWIIPPADAALWEADWLLLNAFMTTTYQLGQTFYWDYTFWETELLPLLMMMAEQLSATGMQQMEILGGFLDAKEQLETQRLFQQLHAEAHSNYHPSIGMCEFGTRAESLAASDRKGELAALVLSHRSVDRMLGSANVLAAGGIHADIRGRVEQFRDNFCDPADNNDALDLICGSGLDLERLDNDIDYGRAVAFPLTIDNVNLADSSITDEEQAVFAMANNLYNFDTFFRPDPRQLANDPGQRIKGQQQGYLEMRSVAAKLGVAESSFNALMAMKTAGTDGSFEFLAAYLEELGVPLLEIRDYIGENPSYYAQMEILTKKAYQSPNFYTNLYDTPANVERKGAAIQAIGLIQKFDLFRSYLRTEASLSILLELAVNELQREIEDVIREKDSSLKKN